MELFPAQRFFLKLFDKLPLDNYLRDIAIRDQFNEHTLHTFTELEYYAYLQAENRISMPYEEYMESDIVQIQMCMGRRASKSTMTGIYCSRKLYEVLRHPQPQKYFGILPNDPINITLAALGQDNAARLFKKFVGILRQSRAFDRHMLDDPSATQLRVWSEHDLRNSKTSGGGRIVQNSNSITVTAVPNTPGVRGEGNMFVIMEEFAHFMNASRSSRDKPLDEAIHEALTPSIADFNTPEGKPFGKILILSSPNGKKGKFYFDYERAFDQGAKSFTLAIRAPTWEVNPGVNPAFLKERFNNDPTSYKQEFGAEFIDGGTGWITELGSFYRAFDTSIHPTSGLGTPKRVYSIGVDFALQNDGTAVSIAHYEPAYQEDGAKLCTRAHPFTPDRDEFIDRPTSEKVVVDYSEVRYAKKGDSQMYIEDVIDWIHGLYQRWPIAKGMADQWSAALIDPMIKKKGIRGFVFEGMTEAFNDAQYKLFMNLLNTGQLKLPYDEHLMKELLALQVERRSRDIIKVEAPPGQQFHDDQFDSMIRAVWLAYEMKSSTKVLGGRAIHGGISRPSFGHKKPSGTLTKSGSGAQRVFSIVPGRS